MVKKCLICLDISLYITFAGLSGGTGKDGSTGLAGSTGRTGGFFGLQVPPILPCQTFTTCEVLTLGRAIHDIRDKCL